MSKAMSSLMRMRIIALPLTSQSASTGLHTYYYFQTPTEAISRGKPSLLKRVVGKTSELWAGFGKAKEGSWKRATFKYGERIMDKIEFEELSLKSMDPSLGPKLSNFGKHGMQEPSPIPLLYPAFYEGRIPPLKHLKSLLEKRAPSHRKGFYFWALISPLTAPFMLIPLIPNLPFFFCAWRSWHHYRAYKASLYLNSLIEHGAIVPKAEPVLDQIYEENGPSSVKSSIEASSDGRLNKNERIILSREAVPNIVSIFDLPSSAEADLYRALEQTESKLEKQ